MTGSGISTATFAEVGDLRIAYGDHAPRNRSDRPPILLLHGAVQTRRVWDGQVEAFSRDRRVVVPDLRGHGETGGDVSALTIEAMAGDMFDFLDALGIRHAVICGVSLGGMVALEMAARASGRIEALILADTPLALSLDGPVRAVIEKVGPQAVLRPLFHLLGRKLTARLGLAGARWLFGRNWVGRAAADHFVAGFSTMPRDAVVATYAAVVAADPIPAEALGHPCLIVVGRHETRLVVSHAGEIARRLGRAEIVAVDGGHVPNIDAPEAFNAAVNEFLDRLA